MANLLIKTKVNNVYVVGDFCNWSLDGGLTGVRKDKHNLIKIENMPEGEYRVLCCAGYWGGEIYPTDGRQMSNRYFNGKEDEKIYCYF